MGDNLPFVDLAGATALQLSANAANTCALLSNHQLKCWGDNFFGQLGQGDTLARGDKPSELGTNLNAINVGTGRTVQSVASGGGFTCALLDDGSVKCFGRNDTGGGSLGTLSIVRTPTPRRRSFALPAIPFPLVGYGVAADQMGDSLAAVALGTGHHATAISAGTSTVCAILETGQTKCWGDNSYGELGLGDTKNRGALTTDMGDSLPFVNLNATSLQSVSVGNYHACALLSDSSLKCWGDNRFGELGLGDTNARGVQAGQMGAALPAINY